MDSTATGSGWRRWWTGAIVFALTATVLILLRSVLAALGAHEFLTQFGAEALKALAKWEPHRLAVDIYELQNTARCTPPAFSFQPPCAWWEGVRMQIPWLVRWPVTAVVVIAEQFVHSPAAAVISAIQLVAGAVAAVWFLDLMDRAKSLDSIPGPILFAAGSLLTLVFATILAIPLLGMMYVGAEGLVTVIPKDSELPLYLASIVTFFYLFVGRSIESGVEDLTSKAFGRLISYRKPPQAE